MRIARAQATIEQLERLLGTIHVASNVPAEVWVGERLAGEAPGDVLVPGGRHVLELRAEGRIPARREVEVAAGGEVSVEIALEAAQEIQEIHEHRTTTNVTVDAPPLPVWVTASMVVASVAALGVGVGFGVRALVLSDDEHDRDPRLPRDGQAIDDAALLADVFLIGGGVLAAATVAMAFLTDWDGESDERLSLRPVLGPRLAGLALEVRE